MKFSLKYTLILLICCIPDLIFGQSGMDTTKHIECIPSPWLLHIHASPMQTSLKSNKFSEEESTNWGYTLGFDVLYQFKNTGRWKVAASIGANYSYYTTTRSLNFNDSVWMDDYLNFRVHLFEKGSMKESQKVGNLHVPIKLHLAYELNQKWGIYFNTGYFLSATIKKDYHTDAIITRQGFYPGTNCLVFDVDVDGSHLFYPTNKPVQTDGQLQLSNRSGVEFNGGLSYKINERISLFGGIKAMYNFGSVSNFPSDAVYTYSNDWHSINSLMGRGDQITQRAIGLEFGLAVHLGKCRPNTAIVSDVLKLDSIKTTDKDSLPNALVVSQQKDSLNSKINPIDHRTAEIIEKAKADSIQLAVLQQEKKSKQDSLVFDENKFYTVDELTHLLSQKTPPNKTFKIRQHIEFEYNTSNITDASEKTLDALAVFIQGLGKCHVNILGYTDNKGTVQYNKALSMRRAQAALDYLANKGMDRSMFTAIGKGMDDPIDTNNTPEGRRNNRRVDFEIIRE